MNYKIARGNSIADLMETVNAMLEMGYVCLGGVAILGPMSEPTFYQAMIKNSKTNFQHGY